MDHSGAMTERFHALDSLRASMMLLGIFLHVSCAYCNLPDVWWYRDAARTQVFDFSLLYIHIFRMPVFMVMAGFFSALLVERRGVSAFLTNRYLRIAVPLVLGVLTLYPILFAMGRYGRAVGQPNALDLAWQALISARWLQYMNTTHLWFLNYLLWLYVLAIVVRWIARPVAEPVCQWAGRSLTNWVRSAPWPFFTFVSLSFMEFGLLDTKTDWTPVPRVLAAYAVFFGFGWLLYSHRDKLSDWTRGAWTKILLTIPLTVLNAYWIDRQLQNRSERDWVAFFGAALTGSIIVWLMIFGLTGLFLRHAATENARWRYLSDSAYWMYILHSPVVLFWQLLFAEAPLSAFIKCALVTVLSVAVLLLTYDAFVRSTWMGVLLNGRRYPRRLFARASPPPSPAPQPSAGLGPAV